MVPEVGRRENRSDAMDLGTTDNYMSSVKPESSERAAAGAPYH